MANRVPRRYEQPGYVDPMRTRETRPPEDLEVFARRDAKEKRLTQYVLSDRAGNCVVMYAEDDVEDIQVRRDEFLALTEVSVGYEEPSGPWPTID